MKKRNIIGLVVLVAIISPWLFNAIYIGGSVLYGKVDESRYHPTAKFDSKKWQYPNRKYRYAVLDTVANKTITIGMTKAEVLSLLGQPDVKGTNNTWQYETKRPGWRFIDFSGGGIAIHFTTNNIVEKTEINTWID